MPRLFIAATFAGAGLTAAPALAGPPPDYGFDWRTIGDPGNAPTDASVKHPHFLRPLGAVDYEYRLTTTEVTYTQQLEFLHAYGPHMDASDVQTWGELRFLGYASNGPRWEIRNDADHQPGMMTARLWVRFTNWLHNDKALTADAFESGAYDTSTFGTDEHGDWTDQLTRSAGARYWVPSFDEWIKGGYWDPNKNGEAQGGYWLYPNGSDTPSVPGLPGEGGETNAGFGDLPLDVGSYPDEQTPWGLLDYSGGGRELIERVAFVTPYLEAGSKFGSPATIAEQLSRFSFTGPDVGLVSLRLASAVPAPGAGTLAVCSLITLTRRRSRPRDDSSSRSEG